MCFDKKRYTLEELLAAVRSNWKNNEIMRQEAINCHGWGDDSDESNELAIRLNNDLYKIMSSIKVIGKYLDQPLLTAGINKKVPAMLTIGAGAVLADTILKSPKQERKNNALKIGLTLTVTAISAVMAPRIAGFITGRNNSKTLSQIKKINTELVDNFLKSNSVDDKMNSILQKAKGKVLSLKEVKALFGNPKCSQIANELIPPPDNITSKDIFREIGWLSIYGAIPVLGGITGGIVGDRFTDSKWKEKVPNKLKEGVYQYLANIFLCNIGAGAALGILEKLEIKSKGARCLGMLCGILATGVIGVITASPRKEIEQQCKMRGADFFLEKNNDWQNSLANIMAEYIKEEKGEQEDF